MRIASRLKSLERQRQAAKQKRYRFVVSRCRQFTMEGATCTRTLHPDGSLWEMVYLQGSSKGFTGDVQKRFIESFAIVRLEERRASARGITG